MQTHEIQIREGERVTIFRQHWTGAGIYNARLWQSAHNGRPEIIFLWQPSAAERDTPTTFYCPAPLVFQTPLRAAHIMEGR